MNENRAPEANAAILSTWLKALLLLCTVRLVVWLIDYLPLKLTWLPWAEPVLSTLGILYLFQLGRANRRYRKSAIFRTVLLCYGLYARISVFFPPSYHLALSNFQYSALLTGLLLPVLAILSLLAVYQEYHAHADVTKALDPRLSGKWHALCNWYLGGQVLIFFVSMAVTLLVVSGYLDISMSSVATAVSGIVTFVLQLVSILYLCKTVRLLRQ